jgi:hypothetical protein
MPCTARRWRLESRFIVTLIWLAAVTGSVLAQTGDTPSSQGGVGLRVPTEPLTFGASAGTEILRHRSATGVPCLTVSGLARPHTVSPNVYDHVISVKNSCPQRIAMRVCYYKSQDCVPMEIPGGERREAVLGSLPSVRDFRFEFREKF